MNGALHTFYPLAVLIHVVAAVIWAGGVLFIGFIAYPAARQLDEETRTAVMAVIGRRFRSDVVRLTTAIPITNI